MINIPDDCGYQLVGNMMRSSEKSGKRKRTTRMDIMEPSPNASTEQKQLASSYQRPYAPAGAKKEGEDPRRMPF